MIWPVVREVWVPFNTPLENVVHHMYLDVRGLVTVWMGNLIDPVDRAIACPFLRIDGSEASEDEIAAEWYRVKSHRELARLGHTFATKHCELRIDNCGGDLLVSRQLEADVRHLVRRFPALPEWPADAQLAVLSMAWAMGSGFWHKFPRCSAFLDAWDFAGAATECKISEAGNAGVVPRNVANKAMLLNAAQVMGDGLPREVLLYEVRP